MRKVGCDPWNITSKINEDDWEDRGTYVMSRYPQGHSKWFELRDINPFFPGVRNITASKIGEVMDVNPWGSPTILAYEKVTGCKRIVKEEARLRMAAGSENEVRVCRLYEQQFNVRVDTANLCINKAYPFIGASPDGFVGDDGCVEFKYVGNIKGEIYYMAKQCSINPEFRPSNSDHLWPYYAMQMQTQMWCTGRKWCDFAVYCHTTKEFYTEKVPFQKDYWERTLFPAICDFQERVMPEVAKNLQHYHALHGHLFE